MVSSGRIVGLYAIVFPTAESGPVWSKLICVDNLSINSQVLFSGFQIFSFTIGEIKERIVGLELITRIRTALVLFFRLSITDFQASLGQPQTRSRRNDSWQMVPDTKQVMSELCASLTSMSDRRRRRHYL